MPPWERLRYHLNNGTMKYSVFKDLHPESVVQENIIRSLQGAAVDMARYMGPTTSVAHILKRLSVLFGMS